ncbi:hypothetical protein RHMOL_Rhmol08G0213000 [Rhododendron molle]|uniref:Uncharacterized protein n=1 Tax=Rhododendron molle TaxID=49168 RepID=A0ACC0MS55_RHOML|nr:hypothetical protein RHMOL_Rhmol08G0213000 [Rhododendron molle]
MTTAHPEVKAAPAESVPPEITKAPNDATTLHRAFEGTVIYEFTPKKKTYYSGKGCDETTIVSILANRSATERALLRKEYNTNFSEDLDIARLSEDLGTGDLNSY